MTTNECRPLGDQVRDFYLSLSLPEERVEVILSNASEAKPGSERLVWMLGIAAAAVFVLAGALLLSSPNELAETVAAEAISNYKKGQKKLVHPASRYEELETLLADLEFPLSDLAAVVPPNLDLEGGRYCSLQGQPSALLRLRRKSDGQTGILYVAPRDGTLARLGRETVGIGDYEVDLWHDQLRFFALTFEPASSGGGSAAHSYHQPV